MTDLEKRLITRLKADLGKPLLSESILRKAVGGILEEMREPSEAMLEAGPPEPYMDLGVWRAMIDAALSPQEEG